MFIPFQKLSLTTKLTLLYALVWLVLVWDWMALDWLPPVVGLAGLFIGVPVAAAWVWAVRGRPFLVQAVCWSIAYVPVWTFSVVATDYLIWDGLRGTLVMTGSGVLYLIGLAWVACWLERLAYHYEARRAASLQRTVTEQISTPPQILLEGHADKASSNPLDPSAWYYGGRGRKLNQSLTALVSYSALFTLLAILLTNARGCGEVSEMPAGGGGGAQASLASPPQTVKIQKVIKHKLVINPFSSVIMQAPPIEEVNLELNEITEHQYAVNLNQLSGVGSGSGFGFGDGDGNGFGEGTARGKVRFIRLEYAGGDWDQDFGVGADFNMLTEYGIRTKHKINTETESRTISQLKNFVIGKSPPFVYLTGQRSISISESERRILREYLLDKHGMIFCDNGGSRHFHNQFLELMNRVLEGKVEPVPVALDDPIHSAPYRIPFLPYVAPHGGKEALGWKVDGRWVAYYSPGDIADAWSDGHAGVKREVWEYCYQLGTNVIFYAHVEYSKWLSARAKR